MKNFVKAMGKHGKGFEYLREKFPKLGDSKLTLWPPEYSLKF